jgi:hypothetical protein
MGIKVRQTISDELFQMWKDCRTRGDVNKITEETKLSRPVIERALNSGFVVKEGLADTITYYFAKRLEGSRATTNKLKSILDENGRAEKIL